ncbi:MULTISPECIES: PIN domain-containing protein [Roseomonadaceae]|uniref:Ribonuclease VapC n=1 Tax=Falsiroseomonas oleicola TaxID=2801474 RepID=A0ABS6HBK9_9PROT|nr:PIN domain-containing protein [Roseomonas oleicola]MBU8545736.1 PIN domain-containing protein [Roseomonas oleicola]
MLLDASAVLALLRREPGADVTAAALPAAVISAVNWTEVAAKLLPGPPERMEAWEALQIPVLDYDAATALDAARLLAAHRGILSLGDCACLATAARQALPVLTADRVWATLGLAVEVRLIR